MTRELPNESDLNPGDRDSGDRNPLDWEAALRADALAEDVAAAEQALEDTPAAFALSAHARAAARAAFASSLPAMNTPAMSNGTAGLSANRHGTAGSSANRHGTAGSSANRHGTAGPAREPLRARRSVWGVSGRWTRAAAAVLLIGFASFALWSGNDATAEAGIALRTVQRIDEASAVRTMPSVERGRIAPMGEVFRAARHELLALEVSRASLYVLREGDTLRVAKCACDALLRLVADELDPGVTLDISDVLFHLDAGEVRVSAADRPMPVWIPNAGLLVVTRGAAHVVADIGIDQRDGAAAVASTVVPAIALAHDSQAFFVRAGRAAGQRVGQLAAGQRVVHLSAGQRVLLTPAGVESFGRAAQSLFRELQFFGGVVPTPPHAISVPAQRWHVRSGTTHLRAEGLRIDLAQPVRLAWRVPARLDHARTLRVAVRGPAGLTVRLPALDLSGHVPEASSDEDPGVRTVTLALPAQWTAALDGYPLEVEIVADMPASGRASENHIGWFDGAVFVIPASSGVENESTGETR